jgi:hypothetical protein
VSPPSRRALRAGRLTNIAYHISTLLQVSFVARHQDGNNPLAADLCERALFTFGRATLASFRQNLLQGRARLDFYRPENRQLWLVGYHYLKSLIRKGASRTALEWAKLLFSLDPVDDPFGMLHLIHVLAVKGHETKWLQTFVDVFEKSTLGCDIRYYRNSIVLGLLQDQDLATAKEMLVGNMQDMPWLYCALFQALNLDAPPSIWGVQPPGPGSVDEFYTELYVQLTKDMWNYPQATSLLKAAASIAKKPTDPTPSGGVMELRTARFVYLEGISSLISLVPHAILDRQPNYEFDPLPPAMAENVFSGEGMRRPFLPNQQLGAWLDNFRAGEMVMLPGRGDLGDDDFEMDDFLDEFEPQHDGLEESEFDEEEDIDDDGLGDFLDAAPGDGATGTTFQRLSRSVREALFGNGRGGADADQQNSSREASGGVGGAGEAGDTSAGAEEADDATANTPSRLPGAWPGNDDDEQQQ